MAAAQAVLGIDKGDFYYGAKKVFENISFQLDTARTGLVGENGAGKSTLLNCLTGNLQLTAGKIVRSASMRTSYLAQDVPDELLPLTVRQVLERCLEKIDSHDYWKVDVLLNDIGAPADAAERLFGSFSGGWQRLFLIAGASALEDPSILILDEPTNHLDIAHLNRLEEWLLNDVRVPMLVVSHDREFLDKITTRTLFLRSDGAHMIKAPFLQAREELLQRDAAAAAQRALEDKEIERLQAMANRYKAWGVLQSSFHKKQKATEKRIDRLKDERASTYVKKERVLGLSDNDLDTKVALRVENLTVTIPDGSRALYHIEKLLVKPGDKVALLGPNGTGKTMLLNALANVYNPNQKFYDMSGPIKFNPSCNLVYFDQRMKNLPLDMTLMDYIEAGDISNRTRTIALLAKAGFDFTRSNSQIKQLSYGERSRLTFLKMKLMQPNFYLLDEPTNHLDIEGQEDLESQLENSEVSCIFVSHDRFFTRTAGTKFYEVKPGKNGGKLVQIEDPDEFFANQTL